jgi:hypothetical protein
MKSAYELAMERLGGDGTAPKLTDEQRSEIAEINSVYDAKLAEREIFVTGQLEKAREKGDFEAIDQLEKQIQSDRRTFESARESKKEKVRQGSK